MDDFRFEIQEETRRGARIKVIGVGGGGSNAVGRMFESGLDGVEFYVVNTDAQALGASRVPNRIQIGEKITGGLGAGSDPEVGRRSALEDTDRIVGILEGADLVFVTAGLGGGTGGGAAPVIASLAKSLGALTISIVTKPFDFEGVRRMQQATASATELADSVDILTTVPNQRLLQIAPRGTGMKQAFRMADEVLRQAVEGISEIILNPGLIGLDFSDIRAAVSGMGHALIGNASASGENAAVDAARTAISLPLLEDTKIWGATQVLMNFSTSRELGLHELNDACTLVRDACGSDETHISFGVIEKPGMGEEVRVTVIATGFADEIPAMPEPVIRDLTPEDFFAPREAAPEIAIQPPAALAPPVVAEPEFEEPAAEAAPVMEPESEPEPVLAGAGISSQDMFEDEFDVPAYVRQGKLIG